jgi:hypothetical protein
VRKRRVPDGDDYRTFTLTPPAKGLVPLGCGRREIQTGLFVTEKQPTSIAIGRSEPVSGRDLRPPKSSEFHRALFRELRHCCILTRRRTDGDSK